MDLITVRFVKPTISIIISSAFVFIIIKIDFIGV